MKRLIRIGLLVLVSSYIVLSAGFMLIRIPPTGPGVPIGEIVVFLGLGALFVIPRMAASFLGNSPTSFLFIFWAIGLCHLFIDGPNAGFWAFRDAAHLFETTYLWIGFWVAASSVSFDFLYKWMGITFRVATLCALTYPLRDVLAGVSPQISSAGAYSIPLFFAYLNMSSSVITGLMFSLSDNWSRHGAIFIWVSAAAVVLLVTLVQVRVAYLQLAIVTVMLFAYSPQSAGRWLRLMVIGVVGVLLFASLNLDLEGRLGTRFTLDFLLNHIQAIWGGGDGTVKDAADGVGLRLRWWQDVQDLVFSGPLHTLFGVGYGEPLTTFAGPEGDITREPHNSFISVMARYGLVGLAAFLYFQAHLVYTVIWLIRMSARLNLRKIYHFSLTALAFFGVNLLFSIVEGGFEVSYVAIPYYFMAGLIYGVRRNLLVTLSASSPIAASFVGEKSAI